MDHQQLDRAYSIFEVKDFNDEQRTIEGIATSPVPDRVGDVIEPSGVTFANPVKLLLYHDKTKPVGHVTFSTPTKDGVQFKAFLPKIAEAGTLRERVEEAWQSIKYKLLTGVSIGFRVIDRAVEPIRDSKDGGYRFLKTELLELSLVSVPAHQNATITLIKSLDSRCPPAALGTGGTRVLSGVSDVSTHAATKDAGSMKTPTETRAAFEATRAAKGARMNELMIKAGDDGTTLDVAGQTEYDELEQQVKDIDAHLRRLASLETLNLHQAKPVDGSGTKAAEQSRVSYTPSVQVIPAKREPGIEFARYAMCLAAAKGNEGMALEIAKSRYPQEERIQTILKASVAAGTTTDPTWAGALVDYVNFAGDFVEFLRPQTIIGKFGTNGIPSLRNVPFNISVPGQTTGGEGYWVGEGKPKPVTKFDFQNITLRWAKVANIAVLTQELVRFSNPSAERLVREALAAAIIERIDTDFVDPAKAEVADVSPASITNGIAAIPSSGSEAIDVRTDMAALFGAFIAANLTPTTGVIIMNATIALALSLMVNTLGQPEFPGISMTGGSFMGLPVIVSQYVPTGIVILVNASDIYLADDGQVVIDASREAALQMLDNPTNATADTASPPAPIATAMVSLWQTNSIGLKAERFINWRRRREEAVALLEDVAWAAGSPA